MGEDSEAYFLINVLKKDIQLKRIFLRFLFTGDFRGQRPGRTALGMWIRGCQELVFLVLFDTSFLPGLSVTCRHLGDRIIHEPRKPSDRTVGRSKRRPEGTHFRKDSKATAITFLV